MLRPFIGATMRLQTVRPAVRAFSVTSQSWAKAPAPGGKQKTKTGYKKKTVSKVKKGGMTDLPFRDAIRELGYEKYATPINELNIDNLKVEDLGQEAKMTKYSSNTLQKLKTLAYFKKYQYQEMFSEPVTLAGANTRLVYEKFISKLNSGDGYQRALLHGPKGNGKSTLLAQASALIMESSTSTSTSSPSSTLPSKSIVLHFNSANKLRDGSCDYIFNKKIQKYQQPTFTKNWINQIREANQEVLQSLKLSKDVTFVKENKQKESFKKDLSTLYDFLGTNEFGKQEESSALQIFLEELQYHSKQNQVSIVWTVDDISDLINLWETKYRHPDFTPIQVQEFELGNLLINLLTGKLTFNQGGALFATRGDPLSYKTLAVGIGHEEYDPFWKNDLCKYELANDIFANKDSLTLLEPGNFSKQETRTLLEFFNKAGTLHLRDYERRKKKYGVHELEKATIETPKAQPQEVFDNTVQAYYTMTSGNVGGLVKSTNFLYQ